MPEYLFPFLYKFLSSSQIRKCQQASSGFNGPAAPLKSMNYETTH